MVGLGGKGIRRRLLRGERNNRLIRTALIPPGNVYHQCVNCSEGGSELRLHLRLSSQPARRFNRNCVGIGGGLRDPG